MEVFIINFCIGETEYFNAIGLNTEHWRKSLDGTLAVVHYDMVQFVADDSKITLYRHDDEAFKDVMMSEEWTEQMEEDII